MQVIRTFKESLRPRVLSGWNISTRLSIPDKDGGGTTPISPGCNQDGSQWRFRSGGGYRERFPWTMGQRRNRDTVYYFEIALGARDITSSTFTYVRRQLVTEILKTFLGGQITGRRSSIIEIYSVKLLEILNFTQKNCANVSREARILMKRKSLVRKKGSSIKGRRKGWTSFWMNNEICDIKITAFDASAIKSYTSQRVKKEFAEFQGKVRRCDAILWIIYLRISFVECKLWKLK